MCANFYRTLTKIIDFITNSNVAKTNDHDNFSIFNI